MRLEEGRWIDREVNFGVLREGVECVKKASARTGADDDLPGVAKRSFFVESRGGEANDKLFGVGGFKVLIEVFGVFNSERFGFVGDGDFAKIIKGREVAEAALT